ncbi:MAG: aminoglycoside phosphotransferase family protein [Oscillospiraceae bacterium]|nr:aminoglycoside phosphotransferase family protein [Oscillospiraceae bacterium]
MIRKLAEVGKYFRLPGEVYSYTTMKNGNINATYRVTNLLEDGSVKSYVFQRINTHVFKNPVEIMENIDRVTSHIRARGDAAVALHYHHAADGLNYMLDDENGFWRVMNYVDSVTYDISDDPTVIYETGVAFGLFQLQLSDFDGATLHETIPNFHNTKKRIEDLFAAAARNAAGRADSVREELAYIASVRSRAERLSVAFANGEFPARVTHNDTKCNNVLFDKKTKKPLVVIDLDTVMPGMSMYDFADAARFICSSTVEDEPDTFRVFFDLEKFRALARGYVGTVRAHVTPAEIDTLVEATFAITIEIAARFLSDYLEGDVYFKTLYPEHNLVRARCQIALAKSILSQWEEMEAIIREV